MVICYPEPKLEAKGRTKNMENQKTPVVERLKQANNILVTVSNNPTVDQLAACIGLTLALNKMGKHATAVFSGTVPSTIEFLQPEKTIEKNTDSLQDFIIALDKAKADKLRYKVEDKVVKIFITPYRTSISQKDLEFSQGDFNVDAVLALGVHQQADLDQAIMSHGRILHDATVMSVNVAPGGELGSVNWLEPAASSLSELGVRIINDLDQKLIDGQIATAFLTGIVAETDRFSNQRTSPQTMSISAQLMSSGANQQLVATKLQEPVKLPSPSPKTEAAPSEDGQKSQPGPAVPTESEPKPNDGTIEIEHDEDRQPIAPSNIAPEEENVEDKAPQIHIDDQGKLHPLDKSGLPPLPARDLLPSADLPPIPPPPPAIKREREDTSRLMTEPPTFETPPLTANAAPEKEDQPTDPLGLPEVGLLNREPLPSQQPVAPPTVQAPSENASSVSPRPDNRVASSVPTALPSLPPAAPSTPAPGSSWVPPSPSLAAPPAAEPPTKTLSQIEQDVNSPHIGPAPMPVPAPTVGGLGSTPNFNQPVPSPAPSASPPSPTASDINNGTNVDAARNAVEQAINSSPDTQEPEALKGIGAQDLSGPLHPTGQAMPETATPQSPVASSPSPFVVSPTTPLAGQSFGTPQPPAAPNLNMPPATPPPVPPPMMPTPPSFPQG